MPNKVLSCPKCQYECDDTAVELGYCPKCGASITRETVPNAGWLRVTKQTKTMQVSVIITGDYVPHRVWLWLKGLVDGPHPPVGELVRLNRASSVRELAGMSCSG
jgi:hypothetical protein